MADPTRPCRGCEELKRMAAAARAGEPVVLPDPEPKPAPPQRMPDIGPLRHLWATASRALQAAAEQAAEQAAAQQAGRGKLAQMSGAEHEQDYYTP